MNTKELNVLAALVFNLWHFYRSGCRADLRLHCRANAKDVTAKDMFFRLRNYIFVKPDSLPLDPNFKALGVNIGHQKKGSRLYFETTLIDWTILAEKMKDERMESKGIELRGRRFFYNGAPVVVTNSRQHFIREASPRTVFYTNDRLEDTDVEPLVHIAEMIWNCNCFADHAVPKLKSGESQRSALPTRIDLRQVQEMRQEMVQLIVQEQKPMMIIQMRQCAMVAHRSEILAMNNAQLDQHIRRFARINPFLKVS